MKRLFLIIFLFSYSLQALSNSNLTEIKYTNLNFNEYKVTFSLDKQVKFKVTPVIKQGKIIIDFGKSNFLYKTSNKNKLDKKFIKSLKKSTINNKELRITLELSPNTYLHKSYAIVKDGKLLTTIELKNNSLKARPIKNKNETKTIIMIDPGHGGSDCGTIGNNPIIYEKDITLKFAKELKKELLKYPNYKVIMTRETDKKLSLSERQKLANQAKADIFISLHADSNPDIKLQGASVYTLSQEAMDEESHSLSEKENKEDILKNNKLLEQNHEIANILIDMVYYDTKNSSIKLAEAVALELGKDMKMMHKLHRSAGFKVLKGVDIPAILVEIGYISNAEESKLLNSYMYKKIFARAMVEGINEYINKNSKKTIASQ